MSELTAFTPDASNLVWIEGEHARYRAELIDCVPSEQVHLVREITEPIRNARFVTPSFK